MKRIRLTLLWLSLATHALIAQNADSLLKSDSDKLRSYESKAKSKAAAIMLAWLLPSAGHAYAGNWSRGMGFVAGEVGGILLLVVGTERGFILTKVNTLGWIGLSAVIVIRFWEYFDAASEVGKFNDKLYEDIFERNPTTLNVREGLNGVQFNLSFGL